MIFMSVNDDLVSTLSELSKERPLFHSEADFQHALAWKIHQRYNDLKIRLEKRLTATGKDIHVDIFALGREPTVIEVKYRTKYLESNIEGEEFSLKDQSATDAGRYEFVKDVSRIESALQRYPYGSGTAILLTNDKSFWEKPVRNKPSADDAFRVHEGKVLSGKLEWKEGMKSWDEPLTLKETYTLRWNDYSDLKIRDGKLRYVAVQVKP